jgi:hypothetical protein
MDSVFVENGCRSISSLSPQYQYLSIGRDVRTTVVHHPLPDITALEASMPGTSNLITMTSFGITFPRDDIG